MVIATTAPSGNVGRHVVHHLVRAGVRPRVLAHRSESVDPALREHVLTHVVDLGDRSALGAALSDVEALYVTVPSATSPDPLADYERFGSSLVHGIRSAGVSRVVLQSSVGAELRRGVGEIDGLARVEELLDAAGVSVVHLRCGFFYTNLIMRVDDLRAGEVAVALPTDHAMPWVAPSDIAEVAASWLLRPAWSGRHVQGVHGPRDLSWDDAMAIVTEATGHHVEAREVGDDVFAAALADAGLSARQVEAVLGMSTGLRDGFVPEQPRDAVTTTGSTLEAWSYDVLRPALRSGV